ncbi:MAG TPA: ATP-dependent DNA helicase [Steroidobacteraceae bacterium]|jgi:ATP-dependent DNA helicase DinG
MLELEDIFGEDGPLQRALGDFRVRRQQLLMAERIAAALGSGATLAVEAGTGTGKTFAYLVPALLCGRRVLISTGTRTLQDQLFSKDLPLVAAALGRPARVALLKGRTNYLCRHRLGQATEEAEQLALQVDSADEPPQWGVRGSPRNAGAMLARIRKWAAVTRVGDLAEVRGLSDSHPVWTQVTSSRENCLGRPCPEFARCHVVAARREALDADIVVVNHHLLLADLALKEDGFGDILGACDAVVLDEAHQIPDLATQFFGAHVSSRRIESLLKEVRSCLASTGALIPRDDRALRSSDVEIAVEAVEEALRALSVSLPPRPGRLSWTESDVSLQRAVSDLAEALQGLHSVLGALDPESALAAMTERAADLFTSLERIAAIGDLEGARAAEIQPRGFALSLMPFDISRRFQGLLTARHCAWIFTSATLSLGEDFSHFTGRLGLQEIDTLKIDSPFDYERQALLYLPTGMPEPASAGYVAAVIDTALTLIEAARGGAFVLFTSHRALSQGAALLRERWAGLPSFRLFVQGEAPRERLLQDFREDGNAVLLGTTSFWEGVDVKGHALRLVIIEKLPFASPDDPLVRARIDHLQSTGGNAFRDYQLPEAALALKQGVGRLIRSEEDFGAVVVCDPRMVGRGYGRVFVSALPAMPVTRDRDEVMSFLGRYAARLARSGAAPADRASLGEPAG